MSVRRPLIALLLMLMSVAVAGCTDISEMKNQSFIVALGIDLADHNRIEASLLVLMLKKSESEQKSGGSSAQPFKIVQETCDYFPDCVNKLHNRLSGRLNLSKVQYVLFGEKLLQAGVGSYIDYFYRIGQMEQTVNFFGTNKSIRDFFQTDKGELVVNIMQSFPYHPALFGIKMWQFTPLMHMELQNGMMSKLSVHQNLIDQGGLYLFRKDRLAMKLSVREAELIQLFFHYPLAEMTLIFDRQIAYQIRKHDVSVRTKPDRADIDVRLRGWNVSIDSDAGNMQTETRIAEQLRKELQQIIDKTQAEGIDFLGIGRRFEQKGRQTADWPDQYKKLKIEIHVSTKILSGYGRKQS